MTYPKRFSKPTADIAVFISPHGFGHASRASAVMEALLRHEPGLRFLIFTSIPGWFFARLPASSYTLLPTLTDVGMVQVTPMQEDLSATLAALERFCAGLPSDAGSCARILRHAGVRLVLADISPLGVLAAIEAGLPSILVENFTWDWIYGQYTQRDNAFAQYASLFAGWYSQASLHIQTNPVCRRDDRFPLVPPASRRPRLSPSETRLRLGIPSEVPTALLSLGSLLEEYPVINAAGSNPGWMYIIPDSSVKMEKRGSLVLLPQDYEIGHPDLAAASDVLLAKSGYSTIAEAYACGTPYGYLNRSGFPESPALAAFLEREMPTRLISLDEMATGVWVNRLEELARLPRRPHPEPDGAAQIARLVLGQLG